MCGEVGIKSRKRIGYKLFRRGLRRRLIGLLGAPYGKPEADGWHRSKSGPGFFCYATQVDVEYMWVWDELKRVRIRNVREGGGGILIAQEMYVPRKTLRINHRRW